jgi:hypothetical protein
MRLMYEKCTLVVMTQKNARLLQPAFDSQGHFGIVPLSRLGRDAMWVNP